jgi:hypothetical protein
MWDPDDISAQKRPSVSSSDRRWVRNHSPEQRLILDVAKDQLLQAIALKNAYPERGAQTDKMATKAWQDATNLLSSQGRELVLFQADLLK